MRLKPIVPTPVQGLLDLPQLGLAVAMLLEEVQVRQFGCMKMSARRKMSAVQRAGKNTMSRLNGRIR